MSEQCPLCSSVELQVKIEGGWDLLGLSAAPETNIDLQVYFKWRYGYYNLAAKFNCI